MVGEAGIPYADEFDLVEKLQRVLRDGSLVQSYRHRAQLRVQKYYDWEGVVDQYEQLFARMTGLPEISESRSAAKHEAAVMLSESSQR